MAPTICVPKGQKKQNKTPSLKWSSQAPPRDMLSHMVWVKSNLVCNRYSSWFNGSGPTNIFWEPRPQPCRLLHPLLSVRARESLGEDPHGGSRQWVQRGPGVLNSRPLSRATAPCNYDFPSSLWHPPENAFLALKYLSTQKTFTETGNTPSNNT